MPANRKISELQVANAAGVTAAQAYVVIVDQTGQNKKISLADLVTAAGGGGGGGGGAVLLNDLTDVTIQNPSTGQILVYDHQDTGTLAFENTDTMDGGNF